MAAQADREHRIDLLGVTLVTGNVWLRQQRAYANKAVERLGIEKDVPVFAGSNAPLVHSHATLEQEKALFGAGDDYWGAWSQPEPMSDVDLTPLPDGPARRDHIRPEHAADFIIRSVRQNPHQVTIVTIGPLTNIALAIRKAPDIVPLIGRIVFMAGAFDVAGNTMPAAEFNVWFDPEAARIVVREPIAMTFFPLDVTQAYPADKAMFDQIIRSGDPAIAKLYPQTMIAESFTAHPGGGRPSLRPVRHGLHS